MRAFERETVKIHESHRGKKKKQEENLSQNYEYLTYMQCFTGSISIFKSTLNLLMSCLMSLLFLIQYSITFIFKMSQRKLNYYDVLDMQESKWTYILMYLQFSVCGSKMVFTGTFLKLMKCPKSTVTHTVNDTILYESNVN